MGEITHENPWKSLELQVQKSPDTLYKINFILMFRLDIKKWLPYCGELRSESLNHHMYKHSICRP